MANDTALVETIEHWERMIAWVETRDLEEEPAKSIMNAHIKEYWAGNFCSLCRKYGDDDCSKCELYSAQGDKSCGAEGTLWRGVHYASTWAEWLDYAKPLLALLKTLQERGENERDNLL